VPPITADTFEEKRIKPIAMAAVVMLLQLTTTGHAEQTKELTCADFKPSAETLERFPELQSACLSVVDSNGALYARFQAVIRRSGGRGVVLYIPAVDRTVSIEPKQGARVNIAGRRYRPQELDPGQEIDIYLSVAKFADPVIDEVAFVTETDELLGHKAEPNTAMPSP
jgi:hypothetical protein